MCPRTADAAGKAAPPRAATEPAPQDLWQLALPWMTLLLASAGDGQASLSGRGLDLKARPTQPPAPVDLRVRHDTIDAYGKVTLRYLGRLRHIPVGTAHKNRRVRS